jgi:hypothetical protein
MKFTSCLLVREERSHDQIPLYIQLQGLRGPAQPRKGREAYLMMKFIEGKTLEQVLADASGPGPSQKKNPATLSMVR